VKSGMTDSDDSIERGKAERQDLKVAGWEPKGRGAETIWKNPADGRWYADYQAVEMQRIEERAEEEDRVLDEHGFERAPTEGANDRRERWVRREDGGQLYTRSQALKEVRRDGS
jgi:streptogramin lyase